jgi:hypothetical protein
MAQYLDITFTAKIKIEYKPENYPGSYEIEQIVEQEREMILDDPEGIIQAALEEEDKVLDGSHANVDIKIVED